MRLSESIIRAKRRGLNPVIAEIKRLIPSLPSRPQDERDAGLLARLYEEGGACGISLVGEREHFGGRPEVDIPKILSSSSLPLLIKDFIREKAEIDFYASLIGRGDLGRCALLLIAHHVRRRLPELLEYMNFLGLEALVEIRDPEDLPDPRSLPFPLKLIGFNNKDIDRLERDEDKIRINAEAVRKIRNRFPQALIISESGHHGIEDVRLSLSAGADAVLVGTHFMLAEDPSSEVRKFVTAGGELWFGLSSAAQGAGRM